MPGPRAVRQVSVILSEDSGRENHVTIEGHLLEGSLLASALSQVLESPEMAVFHQIRSHCLGWCATSQTGYILIQLRVLELSL